jgi:phage-related minor tail protein
MIKTETENSSVNWIWFIQKKKGGQNKISLFGVTSYVAGRTFVSFLAPATDGRMAHGVAVLAACWFRHAAV